LEEVHLTGTLAVTEEWNGTSWTELADLVKEEELQGTGTGSKHSALALGGAPVPTGTGTEEWSGTVLATRTITTS
jgi:hypothetical protein